MFGSEILEIAIGLVFLYLLLSLICSSINEFIASLLNSRAANLEKTLHHLLDNETKNNVSTSEESIATRLLKHPLIENLNRPSGLFWDEKAPSYIPANIFSNALLDTIAPRNDSGSRSIDDISIAVNKLPVSRLRASLLLLITQAGRRTDLLEHNIEKWFDEVMERASAWYKRKTYTVIFYLSLLVTISLNADTLMISETLWRDSGLRASLVTQAEQLAKSGQTDTKQILKVVNAKLENRALPIGWSCSGDIPRCNLNSTSDYFNKILGLLLTAMAVSLGAPFWFDVLNRVVSLRSTGNKPALSKK